MKKILIRFKVVNEVNNDDRRPRLGKGYATARRINPYNPLSYLVLCVTIAVYFLMYGAVGVFEEFDHNPFKWS